jgi:hypothetical protein
MGQWLYKPNDLFADPDQLDKLIDWRMESMRFLRLIGKFNPRLRKDHPMQRQFTVEIRVDYADQEKNEAMKKALQAAARHIYATAVLLADGIKPQIAIFADDFFSGHEEITLLDDTIASGLESIKSDDDNSGVSDEMMAAARSGL